MSRNSNGRGYLTRMGFHNVITNRTMSIASVLVLVSCLMLIGLVFLSALNLGAMFEQFSSRNVIMVYLVPGLESQQIDELKLRLESLDCVKSCEYISGEEAYARVMEKNQGDYKLLEGVEEDFMPDGFEVSPAHLDEFDATVALLGNGFDPAISNVRHFQNVAAMLSAVEKALAILGTLVIGLLMLVSVFIISSTVQATMYSRQQEIKVMKSVGAAPSFIRWPFMVEGICLGVIGSVVALVVVALAYTSISKALVPLLSSLIDGFAPLPFGGQLGVLLPGFLGIGIITGGGGSMLSISRYLKEKVYEKSELEQA